jgi:adenosylmethionine-8-amino-7-oxononanoate aminotransferase
MRRRRRCAGSIPTRRTRISPPDRRSTSPSISAACRRSEEPRAFFTSGGAESIESPAKLARGTSASPGSRSGPSADALREAIERIGSERVAAFFCEPVIGAGGVLAPPDGYFADVRAITRDAGCSHATVAAASHANLDIIERDGLSARGNELELELAEALEPLAAHPLVAEIRSGTGVTAAVQLIEPGLAERASLLSREHGVITRVLLGGALQVSPPLVITRTELDEMATGFAAALDACRAEAATPA